MSKMSMFCCGCMASRFTIVPEAAILCVGCGIALLATSRTYSHHKPFPAHIRTTSRFLALFSHNLELPAHICHNFKYKNQQSIEKTGLSLDHLGSSFT